jgi:cell division protein FtsA
VALDAGTSTITIALGGVDQEGKLHIADIVATPMQGIVRGEIANRQQVSAAISEAIRQVEQKHDRRISDVYTGASGRHIKCTDHDYFVYVGNRNDGEIRREDLAMLHEGMNNVQAEDGIRILDRIPQSYIIDERKAVKEPVGEFGRKLSSTFNFVLASSTLLDRMDKTMLALGITSRRTFPSALASAEAVLFPEEKEMGVAVVDLGAGTTDVSVWFDGVPRFVRSIPLGAVDLNNDIHQQGILDKLVEELKKKFGVAMADLVESDKLITIKGRSPREKQEISQKNLAIIIENRLREIIGFVMAEIGDSGYSGKLSRGFVLTGGGSQLTGIDTLFNQVTGIDVRLALPDANVADECVALAQDPAHATVIGLLLKAAEQGKRGDSLPDVERPSKPVSPTPTPELSGNKSVRPEQEDQNRRPEINDKPDFEEDGIDDAPKKRKLSKWFKGIMDNIMPEPLDEDI